MFNQVQIVKLVIRMIARTSVGTVVNNVVKATTPENLSMANKVMTQVGGFILSSMVSEAGANYVMKTIEMKPEETVQPKTEQTEPPVKKNE